MKIKLIAIICLLLTGCGNSEKSSNSSKDRGTPIPTKYANCFKINQFNGYKHLTIFNSQEETKRSYNFILLENGTAKPDGFEDTPAINIPIDRFIALSSTQLAYIIKLDLVDKLVGVNSSKYLQNSKIKDRIKENKALKLGKEGNFQTEKVIALNPDLIFVSPFKMGGYDKLEDIGLQLMPISAYSENTPLARAEWVKLMGTLFGCETKADSIFNNIEHNYLNLKELAKNIEKKPTIFSGECSSGVWYGVGGDSFLANYFTDAGAEYIWSNDKTTGALRLDFEAVYAKAADADFWRVVNSDREFSYDLMGDKDERYKDFAAFNNKNVIYCGIRYKPFYELTPMEPDVVLSDLIKAIHPELLPNHKGVYYTRLK